jgi:hypothetical protein
VTAADRPYGKFYDFYSISLETLGSTLVCVLVFIVQLLVHVCVAPINDLASDAGHDVRLLVGVLYEGETTSGRKDVWQVSTVATVRAGTERWCFSGAVSSNGCELVVRLSH